MKQFCNNLIGKKWFELLIVGVIIINSLLIGLETYLITPGMLTMQHVILGIFTFEIIMRFFARTSTKGFFQSGWNNFDLFLVLISYIPEGLFEGSSSIMILRILRVFRVLRLLRTSDEIKTIIAVLSKSMSALFYNAVFLFIFLYMFAIVGVSLFRMPAYDKLNDEQKATYDQYYADAPNAPEVAPDPYGTLGESMFTLFRVLSAEDWTDLRYNLVEANKVGLVKVHPAVITGFHVIWFVISAFLLLNLVVGAIVNNYQTIMEETKRKRWEQEQKDKEELLRLGIELKNGDTAAKDDTTPDKDALG